jgi:N-succinyldiaminopimelate aminotransferase
MRRYGLQHVDPATQVLSANGTREALFAVAHALVNPEACCGNGKKPYVLMPNPMYQIYLGAAVTSGATPYLMPCSAGNGFEPELDAVPDDVWADTAIVYVCSPSNPTGWVAGADYYTRLLELADKHDFYLLADECYSEIYWEAPPVGLLEVAQSLGREGFSRCLVFNSLSKRSALPGLRSGLIAGDAELIGRFAKLRSYTGPATPIPLQQVAAAAWSDETHVQRHLEVYRQSLALFFNTYDQSSPPAGSFFVWLPVEDEEAFAVAAYEQQAATILPGSYLGATDRDGNNSGAGYVRAALVDGPEKAAELAERLKAVRV